MTKNSQIVKCSSCRLMIVSILKQEVYSHTADIRDIVTVLERHPMKGMCIKKQKIVMSAERNCPKNEKGRIPTNIGLSRVVKDI